MSQPQPARGHNLPRHPSEWEFSTPQNSLLLNEPFNQTQPGLKAIFQADEAEILQQIVIWRNQPYEDKFLKCEIEVRQFMGRWWTKVPPQMMFNSWSGKLRHINRETAKKKIASLRAQGAMWTANLNEEKGTNVNWYTVIDEVVGPLTGAYQTFWNAVMEERYDALKIGRKLSDAREEELFEECNKRLNEERERLKEAGFLPGKHFPWEEVQKIEREARPQNGGRVNLTPPPGSATQAPLPLGSNLPYGGAVLPEVPANSPNIQGQNDRINGVELASLYKELSKESEDSSDSNQEFDADVEFEKPLIPPRSPDTFVPVPTIAGDSPQTAKEPNVAPGNLEASILLARISYDEHGIDRKTAERLVKEMPESLAQQLVFWPFRPQVINNNFSTSRPAFFVACVKGSYPAPPAYDEYVKAQAEQDRALVAQTAQKAADEARRQEVDESARQARQKAEGAAKEFAAMSPDEQLALFQKLLAQGNINADRIKIAGGLAKGFEAFGPGTATWLGFFEAVDKLLNVTGIDSIKGIDIPAGLAALATAQPQTTAQPVAVPTPVDVYHPTSGASPTGAPSTLDPARKAEILAVIRRRMQDTDTFGRDDIPESQGSVGAYDLEPEEWQEIVDAAFLEFPAKAAKERAA